MKFKKTAACLAGLAFATGVVAKESNVGIFGTSGKGMGDHTYIAQDGPKADNIREVLSNGNCIVCRHTKGQSMGYFRQRP